MQKVYAIVGILTLATLGCTTAIAADFVAGPSCCTSCADQSEVEACECGCSDACDCGSSCGSRCGCGCGICGHHKAHIASFGYFNCCCRGSYKFPVPPQYTYHWPGMYSQQYMTEYSSPYRFPALELPKFLPQEKGNIAVKPVIQSTSTSMTAVNRAKLVPPPMSVRLKQNYGLK